MGTEIDKENAKQRRNWSGERREREREQESKKEKMDSEIWMRFGRVRSCSAFDSWNASAFEKFWLHGTQQIVKRMGFMDQSTCFIQVRSCWQLKDPDEDTDADVTTSHLLECKIYDPEPIVLLLILRPTCIWQGYHAKKNLRTFWSCGCQSSDNKYVHDNSCENLQGIWACHVDEDEKHCSGISTVLPCWSMSDVSFLGHHTSCIRHRYVLHSHVVYTSHRHNRHTQSPQITVTTTTQWQNEKQTIFIGSSRVSQPTFPRRTFSQWTSQKERHSFDHTECPSPPFLRRTSVSGLPKRNVNTQTRKKTRDTQSDNDNMCCPWRLFVPENGRWDQSQEAVVRVPLIPDTATHKYIYSDDKLSCTPSSSVKVEISLKLSLGPKDLGGRTENCFTTDSSNLKEYQSLMHTCENRQRTLTPCASRPAPWRSCSILMSYVIFWCLGLIFWKGKFYPTLGEGVFDPLEQIGKSASQHRLQDRPSSGCPLTSLVDSVICESLQPQTQSTTCWWSLWFASFPFGNESPSTQIKLHDYRDAWARKVVLLTREVLGVVPRSSRQQSPVADSSLSQSPWLLLGHILRFENDTTMTVIFVINNLSQLSVLTAVPSTVPTTVPRDCRCKPVLATQSCEQVSESSYAEVLSLLNNLFHVWGKQIACVSSGELQSEWDNNSGSWITWTTPPWHRETSSLRRGPNTVSYTRLTQLPILQPDDHRDGQRLFDGNSNPSIPATPVALFAPLTPKTTAWVTRYRS